MSYTSRIIVSVAVFVAAWATFEDAKDRMPEVTRYCFTFNTWEPPRGLVPPTVDEQVRNGAPCWSVRDYQRLYGPKDGRATRADIEMVFGKGYEPTLAEYREMFGEPSTPAESRGDVWRADFHDRPHMTRTLEEDLAEVARLLRASRERNNAPPPHQ